MISVFISYSDESDAHSDWVENLSRRLGLDGIQVIFYKDRLQGTTSNVTIMNEGGRCDWILPIVSSVYTRKFNSKQASGVRYEARLISNRIAMRPADPPIIPIIRGNSRRKKAISLPLPMADISWIDFEDDARFEANYQALLGRLTARGEGSIGGVTHDYSLAFRTPALSEVLKWSEQAGFEVRPAFSDVDPSLRFADTPALGGISGEINARAYRETRWAGTAGTSHGNKLQKMERNTAHLSVNPYCICLLAAVEIAGTAPRSEGFFGFTHIIPVKEAAWPAYEQGKVADNSFPAEMICPPEERTSRYLMFSLGFDDLACQRLYGPLGAKKKSSPIRVGLGLQLSRAAMHHLYVLLNRHAVSGDNWLYAQNDRGDHNTRWLEHAHFRPYTLEDRPGFKPISADNSVIRRVRVSLGT